MSQSFFVRFWLFIGFLAVGLVFLIRGNLNRDYQDLAEALKIFSENLSYEFMPPRRAPFGVANKETELKGNLGPIFKQFSADDWHDFWQIIYGVYPEYSSDNERLPPRKRQLSIPEIQEELKNRFYNPFAYFTPEHWQELWSTLKIRE